MFPPPTLVEALPERRSAPPTGRSTVGRAITSAHPPRGARVRQGPFDGSLPLTGGRAAARTSRLSLNGNAPLAVRNSAGGLVLPARASSVLRSLLPPPRRPRPEHPLHGRGDAQSTTIGSNYAMRVQPRDAATTLARSKRARATRSAWITEVAGRSDGQVVDIPMATSNHTVATASCPCRVTGSTFMLPWDSHPGATGSAV